MLHGGSFNPFASQVTGLRIQMVNGEKCLTSNGLRVNTFSLEDGMPSFLAYLMSCATPGKMTFDAPLLLRAFCKYETSPEDLVRSRLVGFADTEEDVKALQRVLFHSSLIITSQQILQHYIGCTDRRIS